MLLLMLTMLAMQGYRLYLMWYLGGLAYEDIDAYIPYHDASAFEQVSYNREVYIPMLTWVWNA